VNRRTFIAAAAASGIATVSSSHAAAHTKPQTPAQPETDAKAAKFRQSVCRWCFGGMSLEDLCKLASEIGYSSVELLGPDEWEVPKRHGMTCAVATNVKSNSIGKGFNRLEHHDAMIAELEERLPLVAAAGIPNQIVFSGNRAGLDDREGLRNCAQGLGRITPLAEKLGVTLVMELLNSKVDHKDYMCDRSSWGIELVQQVASPRFRLLYDIYHMQIMEGDVIRTISANMNAIAHFHTAGVPGRNELDDRQELNYRGIAAALAKGGFTGYLGQEFMPTGDAAESLRKAFKICHV